MSIADTALFLKRYFAALFDRSYYDLLSDISLKFLQLTRLSKPFPQDLPFTLRYGRMRLLRRASDAACAGQWPWGSAPALHSRQGQSTALIRSTRDSLLV